MADSKPSEQTTECQLEIRSILNSKKCGKCELQAITAFCQQCRQFVCEECKGLHLKWKDLRSHNIIKVEDDAQFQNALLATQEVALLIFSTIKQNLTTIEEVLKCFDERKKEISAKKAEVETVVNGEIDTVIQKCEYRRTQLLACLKQDTESVMKKLAHERYQIEEVQKMFNSSLHTAISSFTNAEEREQLMKCARDGVDKAKAMLKHMPLQPTVKPYMTLTDMDGIQEACSSFGRITNVALCIEKSYASGDGLKFARIAESIAVIIHPIDTESNAYTKQVQVTAELIHYCTETSDAPCSVEMQSMSQYSITYKPLRFGKHSLNLCINGNPIKDSPFSVSVHVTPEFMQLPEQCHILRELRKPTGIATDTKGHIIIVEQDANCISIFSADYKKITSFGSQGTAQGQLSKPYGVTTDQDDNIYVTDSGNYRVQKFSSNGKFIAKIGSKGNGDLQFRNLMGITYNSLDKQLYVCDSDNCRIVTLNTDLCWNDTFGIKGSKADQFKYPCSVAFDHCGRIFVTEYYSNNRVQVFSSSKQHLQMIDKKNDATLYYPYSVAFDSGNTMYITEEYCISMFDNCQKFVCDVKASSGGKFSSPHAIHIDDMDKIYVADTKNNRVQLFR